MAAGAEDDDHAMFSRHFARRYRLDRFASAGVQSEGMAQDDLSRRKSASII
jgi:hypothetical protein